jgi:hypothetical protein
MGANNLKCTQAWQEPAHTSANKRMPAHIRRIERDRVRTADSEERGGQREGSEEGRIGARARARAKVKSTVARTRRIDKWGSTAAGTGVRLADG